MDSHRTASPRRSADHLRRSADQRPAYTPEQLTARAAARSKRAAMHRRVRRIRRYVAGLAASLFSVAFLVVYVQLASGHDPALSAKKSTAASASNATTSTASSNGSTASTGSTESTGTTESSGSTESTGTTESTGSTQSSGSTESSGSASAVTTSQS
jgi:hypothetical protein